MPEWEFLKTAGLGGLMFVVFYLYHKSTTKQMNDVIEQTFDLLKTMIEQNTLQMGFLQKIDTKVSNNTWCPYVREKSGYEERSNNG